MRILLGALLLALVLSITGTAALQAAGDDLPNGGSIHWFMPIGGDDLPNGG